MGSLCKPKSTSIPTTTTTVQGSTLPEWVSQGGQRIWDQARHIAQQPYQPYGGERVAPLSGMQQQGIAAAAALPSVQQPYLDRAAQLTEAGSLPWDADVASRYASPYKKQVEDDVSRRMIDLFAGQRNAQQAKAVGARAFGGAREEIELANLLGEQGRAYGGVMGDISRQGYDTSRAAYEADARRSLAAAPLMGALGTSASSLGRADIGTLLGAGALQQKQQQFEDDTILAEFEAQRRYPKEQTDYALRTLIGAPKVTGATSTTSGQQVVGATSPLGQVAGTVGALGSWFV